MAQRTDAIVLGAGIVGTSVALQLAKRGLSVALIDRRGPGEETSYGNTGVIVGASVFPTAFPRSLKKLIQVALKRAPEANYHWGDLLKIAPWLVSYFRFSSLENLKDSAVKLRPLMSRAVAEHEELLQDSGAMKYFRKTGWITLYRSDAAFEAMKPQLEFGAEIGVAAQPLDTEGTRKLEPNLNPVFRHSLFWPDVASLSNPLMVTRAYAARLAALGGVVIKGDARSLHRADGKWRVDTDCGPIDAENAVVALGPWSPDVLEPLGIKVPLGIKRGYHRHFDREGQCLAHAAGDRHRVRLCADAHGAGHPPHHRRGVREPRCAGDARAVRPADAACARAVSARRAERGRAMARAAAEHAGCASRARARAGPERAMACLRSRALGADARAGDGASDRRSGHRRDAVHGSCALSGGSLQLRYLFEVGVDPAKPGIERGPLVVLAAPGFHLGVVALRPVARLFKPGPRKLVELVLVLRGSRQRRARVLVVGRRHGGRLSMTAITNRSRGA